MGPISGLCYGAPFEIAFGRHSVCQAVAGTGRWPFRWLIMDLAILSERLAQAERHVAEGVQHIVRQRTIVADLERNGHDTTLARELLAQFQSTQALHIADRDQLKKELEA